MQHAASEIAALRRQTLDSSALERATETTATGESAAAAREQPAQCPAAVQSEPEEGHPPGPARASSTPVEPLADEASVCPYIGFTAASSNFLDAQSLWDASMAYSISQVFEDACGQVSSDASEGTNEEINPARRADTKSGPLVVHVCGKFHSEGGYGISEHLPSYYPGLDVLLVTFIPTLNSVTVSADVFKREQLHLYGHFIVLTDLDMPRSYAVQHPI